MDIGRAITLALSNTLHFSVHTAIIKAISNIKQIVTTYGIMHHLMSAINISVIFNLRLKNLIWNQREIVTKHFFDQCNKLCYLFINLDRFISLVAS